SFTTTPIYRLAASGLTLGHLTASTASKSPWQLSLARNSLPPWSATSVMQSEQARLAASAIDCTISSASFISLYRFAVSMGFILVFACGGVLFQGKFF